MELYLFHYCTNIILYYILAAANFAWMYVGPSEQSRLPGILQPQKVRLDGIGKMPVADLRNVNSTMGQLQQPQFKQKDQFPNYETLLVNANNQMLKPLEDSATCPKSPVYAMVNKAAKSGKKSLAEQQQHNYCNIAPKSLGDLVHETGPVRQHNQKAHNYENIEPLMVETKDEIIDASNMNYIPMLPANFHGPVSSQPFAFTNITQLPIIPFDPITMLGSDNNRLSQHFDSINRKLRQFHDSLNDPEIIRPDQDTRPNLESRRSNKSKSIDNLELFDNNNEVSVGQGFITMPRSGGAGPRMANENQTGVTMRRSASVPCKKVDRGSTSSSDSGFSPGSPSGNPAPLELLRNDDEVEFQNKTAPITCEEENSRI